MILRLGRMLDDSFEIIFIPKKVENKPLVRIENKMLALLLVTSGHVFKLGRAPQKLIARGIERSLDLQDLFFPRVLIDCTALSFLDHFFFHPSSKLPLFYRQYAGHGARHV